MLANPHPNSQPSEPAPDGEAIELSEAELDAIAGGFVDVSFSLLMSEDSSGFSILSGSGHSSCSGFKKRSLFGLQISGRFESMNHFMSFFSGFMGFLGRR